MTGLPRVHAFLGASQSQQGTDQAVAAQVRAYLGALREHLQELHDHHAGGRGVNEANSDGIDQLIRELFRIAEEEVVTQGGEIESGLAVVAVGGVCTPGDVDPFRH